MDPWGYVDAPPHRVYSQYVQDPVVLPAGRPQRQRRRQVSDDYFRSTGYHQTSGGYLLPEAPQIIRSRSTGNRRAMGPPPFVTHDDLVEEPHRRGRPLSVADDLWSREASPSSPRLVFREHSRTRPRAATSRDPSPYVTWQQEMENEVLRKELDDIQRERERAAEKALQDQRVKDAVLKEQLEALKIQRERDAAAKRLQEEKKRIKDQLLLEQVEAEEKKRKAAEEKKVFEQLAVEKWQREEREKIEKAKLEKEKKDEDYRLRLKSDLGLSDMQIAKIIKKDDQNAVDLGRTTFTKIAKKHISYETLRVYGLPFQEDKDPNYVLVQRWIPEFEQDRLWEHTRKVRRERLKREREAMIKAAEARQKGRGSSAPGLFGFLGGRR